VGRSAEQVEEFIAEEIDPIIEKYKDEINVSVEIKV